MYEVKHLETQKAVHSGKQNSAKKCVIKLYFCKTNVGSSDIGIRPTAYTYCQHPTKLQLQDFELHEYLPIACRLMTVSLLKAAAKAD